MTSLPLVSIGIPTYNRPDAVAKVVRSMLAQSYVNTEIIVCDDGDSARTRAALGELMPRIRYESNQHRLGLYGNWNRTIELGRGELVAVYHDHDAYHPHIVEQSVALFLKHRKVGLVHTAVAVVSPEGRKRPIIHDFEEVTSGPIFARQQVSTWSSFVAHGAMMVRRELYQRLGTFDPNGGFSADMEMLIRFALQTDVGYVNEILYEHFLRRPGDALFDFSWNHVADTVRTRRRNLERVLRAGQTAAISRRKLQRQVDLLLLKYMLWAKQHGRSEIVQEGAIVLAEHASSNAQHLARLLVSDSWAASSARSLAFATRRRLGRLRDAAAAGR